MKLTITFLAVFAASTAHADIFGPVDWPVDSFSGTTQVERELNKAVFDARNSREARQARMGTAGDCAVVAKLASEALAAKGIGSEIHRVHPYSSRVGHQFICVGNTCADNGYFGREGNFALEGLDLVAEYQGMRRVRALNARGRY